MNVCPRRLQVIHCSPKSLVPSVAPKVFYLYILYMYIFPTDCSVLSFGKPINTQVDLSVLTYTYTNMNDIQLGFLCSYCYLIFLFPTPEKDVLPS